MLLVDSHDEFGMSCPITRLWQRSPNPFDNLIILYAIKGLQVRLPTTTSTSNAKRKQNSSALIERAETKNKIKAFWFNSFPALKHIFHGRLNGREIRRLLIMSRSQSIFPITASQSCMVSLFSHAPNGGNNNGESFFGWWTTATGKLFDQLSFDFHCLVLSRRRSTLLEPFA